MRAFVDVLNFELRRHARSPLLQGVVGLFFLLHLLTLSQVGVHLSDNERIAVNSAYLIFRTVIVLGVFGLLPVMPFVVGAATRDHDCGTAELVYATPIGARPLLLGRFAAGVTAALVAGLAGTLGMVAGTFAPWVPADRAVPFDVTPYLVSFLVIAAPNLLVVSALGFAVAARFRSATMAFVASAGIVVAALVVNNAAGADAPAWLSLLEPFGALSIDMATRYWSVGELNTRLPLPNLLANRAVWLGVAAIAFAGAVWRVRLELPAGRAIARRADRGAGPDHTGEHDERLVVGRFDAAAALAQLWSQLRVDLRAVFLSPLSAIVLVLTVLSTVSEVQSLREPISGRPPHLQTALMLGFLRYGLFQFVLMLVIFYAGILVHRERDSGVHEIVGSSPYPDWLLVLSKTLALCLAVSALLLASVMTCVSIQLASGHWPLDLQAYAEGVFVYNGAYFWMLCVLAVVVQVLSPGKWVGMMLTATLCTALLSLEALGFEDLLYGFRIPYVVYSDMNGFGHFRGPTLTVVAYWAAFCVMVLIVAHLFCPRGLAWPLAQRVREAAYRATPPVRTAAGVAGVAFLSLGGWLFYNTHVLNAYETAASRLEEAARWELRYGRYRNLPGPSLSAVTLTADLYPEERRLETGGRAVLRNNRDAPLTEMVISSDPRLRLHSLRVSGARVAEQDEALGFYRYALDPPLVPGATLEMEWRGTRVNRGFVNAGADNEVVENGTYVEIAGMMPWPAYDETRELTRNEDRRRLGLPEAAPLPSLGDPAYLRTVGHGVDGPADLRATLSTAPDQLAVAPGVLTREWQEGGRRYFEYAMERPVWPILSISSARYAVARDAWDGVSLEVYHHPGHPWNVPVMLQTAKQAMSYFSREFAPYPLSHFRILEFPRYRTSAQALPGTVPYSEAVGFLTDLRGWASLDYTTIHELAHHWWGGMAYGAFMQGRQMLNETLAQYSTLMVFREFEDHRWLRRLLGMTHDNYLNGRGRETKAEQPLMRTDDQGNVSYNKGALVMFALQELLGPERMHAALRAYLDRFAFRPPPFPTSRDLVDEIRRVAGPEHQALITDLFEKVVLYDLRLESAVARAVDGGYEVQVDVRAGKAESNGLGIDTEAPLAAPFEIVILPEGDEDPVDRTPLYQSWHVLHTGTQRLTVRVPGRPAFAGVDPYHLMIDRVPGDNLLPVRLSRSN